MAPAPRITTVVPSGRWSDTPHSSNPYTATSTAWNWRELTLANRYAVGDVIGEGTSADVRRGVDMQTGEEVAVKLGRRGQAAWDDIHREAVVYRAVDGTAGFPRLRWAGEAPDSRAAIVTDLLAESVGAAGPVGARRALLLGRQMLHLVRTLHAKGYLHRDLKPENFLFGRGAHRDDLHLIDFGLAKPFLHPETRQHVAYSQGRNFSGTPLFASVPAHRGYAPGRRDDVESLLYVIVRLGKGVLPWENLGGESLLERTQRIGAKKISLPPSRVTEGLPRQLRRWAEHARMLHFSSQPDYDLLDGLLAGAQEECDGAPPGGTGGPPTASSKLKRNARL